MLRKIALALVLLVLVFLAFVATRPSSFTITRSRTLSASPQVVFSYLNDFHRWPDWSPWEKLDPAMKREHGGSPAGPGATYFWSGNSDVGEGRMTITESTPGKNVTLRLEFIEPFAATNMTAFDLVPSGSGTAVTWTMKGEHNFMGKAFSVFMDMDQLVGGDFERGLANLDQVSSAAARAVQSGGR
jgi:uncharacterized protein YndB with AHSA1/START domain